MENTETSSYRENPFFVLGVAPTDNADAIEQAAGDRFFDNPDGDERAYEDAKAILLTPQKRIAAELRWFCGTIASEVQAMCDCLDRGERYRSAFPNMLAEFTFLANTLPSQTPDELVKTIRRLDEIHRALTPEKLMAIVNDDREIAKFPPVQQETLQAAWEEVRVDVRRAFHALGERLGKEAYVKLANDVAQRAFGKKADYGRIVETFLENYELDVHDAVEMQGGALVDLLEAIDPKNVREEQLQKIETMVPTVAALTQPLTAWHVAQGLGEDDLGVGFFYKVRSMSIAANNDGDDAASALRISRLLETAFPILPEEVQKKLAEDLKTLEENEKAAQHSPDYDKIADFLGETIKLVEACPENPEGTHEHARENSLFYMKEWKQNREPRLQQMLAGASCSESEWQKINKGCAYLYMVCAALATESFFGEYPLQDIIAAALKDAKNELAYGKKAGDDDAVRDAQQWIDFFRKAKHDWEEAMAEPEPEPAPRRPQPRPVSLEKPSAPPAPQSQPQRQQQTGGSKFGRLAAAALLLLAVGFGAYHIGASNSAPKAPSMMTTQATTSNSSKPIQKAAKREMKSDLSLGGLDLDMSIDDVRKTLGKENTSEQRGKFNFLLYDNVEVGTYENTVRALVSNGPSAQTKRGIHEGSTLADVQKAYGTDAMVTDYDDLKLYEYSFKSVAGNDGLLRFAVKKSDNTVKYISVRIPEDEKPATKKAEKLDPNEAAQALNDYYQGITHGDARSSYNLLSADMQKHMGSFDQFTSGYQTTLSHKLTDLTLVKQEDPYVTIGYTLTARDRTNTSRVKVQTFHCEATLSKATGSWHIVNVSAKKQSEHME